MERPQITAAPPNAPADVVVLIDGARALIADHWRTYYALPESERLGDEQSWDVNFGVILNELGFSDELAEAVAEEAKLEAQFPRLTD